MGSELTHAVDTYARALRRERPSAGLDARVMQAIERRVGPERRRRAEWRFETRLFTIAAAVAVVLIGAAYALLVLAPGRTQEQAAVTMRGTPVDPALMYPADIVPVDSVVLRVPTTLAGGGAVVPAAAVTADELRFWVDVRIASDGSMRVVRVLPVDTSRR